MKKLKLVKLASQTDRKPIRGKTLFLYLSLVVFISLIILEIWLVNRLSSFGNRMYELKIAVDTIELENQILENELSTKMSLTHISQIAQDLGFISINSIEYLKPAVVASLN